jgi:N-acetyl-anhydromuramyl-L-alanine amidase AmpD
MSSVPEPVIFSRDEWGGRIPDYKSMKTHKIEYITLHHSGVAYYGEIPVTERIKNLEKFSIDEKGWPDIPYHYKIDPDGCCWECRKLEFCGETNTTYDPCGHALICVIGNFEKQKITEAQIDTVVHLCAFLCDKYNINPERIKGHKDYAETLCPGKDFYPYIADGTIRRRVEEFISEYK